MSVAENLTREAGQDFIRDIVRADLASGRHKTAVTRFPPEPNGYLHIGHAKSICLNFGIADEFGGHCNLRYDDTNPTKEDQEFIDAIEGITHSLCTLEFEDHRPLYDWLLENLPVPSHPRQIEFARLNLTYTILSKRVLTELVRGGHVRGWDDPRMPTLAGLRRRGVPPAAIREFVRRIGVAKANSVVDAAMLDFAIREHLNKTAPRRMAVLRPLKIVIENYPDGKAEDLEAANHPDDPAAGTRRIRFGRELYIEHDDFMENPPKKFFRLSPGTEVRLRYAYFITCREVVKDAAGEAVELRCVYDPATKGGNAPDGRKVKATLHWVSAQDCVGAEVRLYNPLFNRPDPDPGNFAAQLNPDSLEVLAETRFEPALAELKTGEVVQFERQGYFCPDPDSKAGRLVFNRTVGLRDTWAKVAATG